MSPRPRPLGVALALAFLALVLPAPRAPAQEAAPGGPKAPPAQAEPPAEVWHAQAITMTEGAPMNITYYWSKGPSLHAETVVAGHKLITLVHHEWYYVVDAVTAKGVAIQRSPRAVAQDATRGRPFGREADLILEQGAEKVGSETHGGTTVDVYRLTDKAARREVWMPQTGLRVPLHVEVFDRAMGKTRRTDYIGWTQEVELSDAFFEPDPRVELERLSYQQYLDRANKGHMIGPAPVLYAYLLHGTRQQE